MNQPTDRPIRVLICDDQEIVRKGLNIVLRHSTGLEVVGLAADGEEAVALALQLRPDVVLMDLKMPRLNGIQATRRISLALPETKVLALTTYDADEWVFDAIRAGAAGYLLKDVDGVELVTAVHDTFAGKTHLDPQVAGKILREFNRREQIPLPAASPILTDLTERELSILHLMAQGKTNAEIADTLFLAMGTVKNNVSSIISKLQANDRTQAVVLALRYGLAHLE